MALFHFNHKKRELSAADQQAEIDLLSSQPLSPNSVNAPFKDGAKVPDKISLADDVLRLSRTKKFGK